MIFKNKAEAWDHFARYCEITEKENTPSFWIDYPYLKDWQLGDWILIQHECEVNKLWSRSRPILGVFVRYSVWDQALVVNFVENPRAWMDHYNVADVPEEYYTKKDFEYSPYRSGDPEISNIDLWTGNIKVLGWWKYKPSIGELRQAIKYNPEFELKSKYVKIHY